MNILFLDQSGKLGGAELSLLDVAFPFRETSLVGLFERGPFQDALIARQIPVEILGTQALGIRRSSSLSKGLRDLGTLLPMIQRVAQRSRDYEIIYTNTPKALVIGALASFLSGRPLVHHLRDIVSPEHFSTINRSIIVTLINWFAQSVIANSEATQVALVKAGGRANKIQVIYNGFDASLYTVTTATRHQLRQDLGSHDNFVVGHFSRLAPWKSQHILIEALVHCSDQVIALLVGDNLFGEADYVEYLHQRVKDLGLQRRVKFLGFRHDIPQLMHACDLVAHTSTAPEPFGRVIVEAMLCARPVVAAAAGGAVELVKPGETGWLCPPNDPIALAEIIRTCANHPEESQAIALEACKQARVRFDLAETNRQIQELLSRYEKPASV